MTVQSRARSKRKEEKKMMKKLFVPLLFFLLASGYVAMAYGGRAKAPEGEMKKITIDILSTGPPTKPAVEDVVTPVLREKTGVTGNLVPHPTIEGASNAQIVEAMITAGSLPHIVAQHHIPPQTEAQKVFHDRGMAWNIDEPTIREYMPNFTKRMDQWGDMKAYIDNVKSYNNTNYLIGHQFAVTSLPKFANQYKGNPVYDKNAVYQWGYTLGLRDDILKKIHPSARSEKEQAQWYVDKFDPNKPTAQIYSDVPIQSMDDLYVYLKKVKDVIDRDNLRAGGDKMIPAQVNANQHPQSIAYSFLTAYGYVWVEPQMFRAKDKAYYNYMQPYFKEVLRWYNKLFNEGLLDPEVFIKPDAQLQEEFTRGRFAVFNNWSNYQPARDFAKDNNLPYGWRVILCWWPPTFKQADQDGTNFPATYYNHFTNNIVTKTVEEEDLAQVLGWLDYHYSEEFDILASWGPEEFWTGSGQRRRFKAAYKDLENFQAYGIVGGAEAKDGYYYGVTRYAPFSIDAGAINWETSLALFFSAWPDAPQYVYPYKKNIEGNYDQDMHFRYVAYETGQQVNFYPQVGWTWNDINSIPSVSKLLYQWFGAAPVSDAITQTVRGSVEDFEKNFENLYMKYFKDEGYDEMLKEYNTKWKEIFDKYIKQYYKD